MNNSNNSNNSNSNGNGNSNGNDNVECFPNLNSNDNVPCDFNGNGNGNDNGAGFPRGGSRVGNSRTGTTKCFDVQEVGLVQRSLDNGDVTVAVPPDAGFSAVTRLTLHALNPSSVPAPAGGTLVGGLVFTVDAQAGCDGPAIISLTGRREHRYHLSRLGRQVEAADRDALGRLLDQRHHGSGLGQRLRLGVAHERGHLRPRPEAVTRSADRRWRGTHSSPADSLSFLILRPRLLGVGERQGGPSKPPTDLQDGAECAWSVFSDMLERTRQPSGGHMRARAPVRRTWPSRVILKRPATSLVDASRAEGSGRLGMGRDRSLGGAPEILPAIGYGRGVGRHDDDTDTTGTGYRGEDCSCPPVAL